MAGSCDSSPPPQLASTETITLAPSSNFASVRISDTEFHEAFARLVLEIPLQVDAQFSKQSAGRLVRVAWQSGGVGADSIEAGYARLCEQRGTPGDCFWLFGDGPHDTALSQRDKLALALNLALTQCREALSRELESLAEQLKQAGSELNKLVTGTP